MDAHPNTVGNADGCRSLANKVTRLEGVLVVVDRFVKDVAVFHDLLRSSSGKSGFFNTSPDEFFIESVR